MKLFALLTDIDGRIGRTQFWFGSLLVLGLTTAITQAALWLAPDEVRRVALFVQAFAVLPWCALAAKRANDRGGSAMFGILLVAAIVLPDIAKQIMPLGWFAWYTPLDTIALMAWVVALIDLGLLPGIAQSDPVADSAPGDKAPAWTPTSPPPLSTPSTRSR